MPAAALTSEPAGQRRSVRVVKQRVTGGQVHPVEEDRLAIEDPLEISIVAGTPGRQSETTLSVTMRTPGHDEDLLAGFLFAEGIIEHLGDIEGFIFNEPVGQEPPTRVTVTLRSGLPFSADGTQRRFAASSSCGVCGTTSLERLALASSLRLTDQTRVAAGLVHELPERMRMAQATFQETGGLHAAALFSGQGELLAAREDIGRHNALDKVVGARLRAGGIPAHGQILCVSGRMSYEILQKALVARVPVIAGVGAPSSLAVTLANDFKVTLLGFVRNGNYNIYSCPERLREAPPNLALTHDLNQFCEDKNRERL